MNQLKGKCVNVVLGIREARGLDLVLGSTYIVANFAGRVMDSDACEPSPSPSFSTELVWETEKKDVRKVRSMNSPLRVELCASPDAYRKKEVIGFTLLSLRSAPAIARCNDEIPYKWYKLIGISSEFRGNHPELCLSLTLRDLYVSGNLPRALPQVTDIAKEAKIAVPFVNQKEIVPIRLVREGLIQIGDNESATENFVFLVNIKSALNLDVMLPERLVFGEVKDKYFLVLDLLGMTVKSKPLDLHETITMNDKIVIRMQSNFEILKEFFEQQAEVYITFQCGTLKLGSVKLNVNEIVQNVAEEFRAVCQNRRLTAREVVYFTTNVVDEDKLNRKPCIDVQSSLIWAQEFGAGDNELYALSNTSSKVSTKIMRDSSDICVECKVIRSRDSLDAKMDIRKSFNSLSESDSGQKLTELRLFSVFILLEKITWKCQDVNLRESRLIFRHPQAKSKLEINLDIEMKPEQKVMLTNGKCRVCYVTTNENLERMMEAWSPYVYFATKSGDCKKVMYREVEFLVQPVTFEDRTAEYTYTAEILDPDTDTNIADINIGVFLEQIEDVVHPTKFDLLPCILDEIIALREIEDFGKWRTEEKKKFNLSMKQQQKEQLALLKKDWMSRKNELEQKLLEKIGQCKELNEQLKKSALNQKVQKTLIEKQEERKNRESYVFEDEVYKNGLKYAHMNKNELVEKITEINEKNDCLNEIIDEQQVELQKYKKFALTKEQTANLLQELRNLQEKYEDLQRSKTYFKEQWKKAVREIHELKAEGQKTITSTIKSNLEELSHLSLDSFLERRQSSEASMAESLHMKAGALQENEEASNYDDEEDEDELNDDCNSCYECCTRQCWSEFKLGPQYQDKK